MVPTMVKQCNKEDYRMLTMDESTANDEAMKVVIHSFLAAQHPNLEQKHIEEMMDRIRDEQKLSSWEICSCQTHICVLLQGEQCLSRMLQNRFLDQVDAELSDADEDRIFLKLPM